MKVIAGLGNPGSEYENTRHNIGFKAVDALSATYKIPVTKSKFNAVFGKGLINGEDVILVKPLTYMNLSGEAISPFLSFFKVAIDDFLVIYDDLDLPAGKIRVRQKGSAGGHNGIKSTISHLHTQEFKRLRIGIGRPDGMQPVVDYVLQPFSPVDQKAVTEAIELATKACYSWMTMPFDQVMNRFNR
ncbi:peptidyl-tRNA hydrolase [Scopulibacillus darangshiensis]|uniref:Peptidyl-tRNA hydrolase n=1 Tax=Scopulibacillus darangshiensis TaxID=442528 RepID=A0A4R2NMR2_9BACL|nr:aminoacyl-tRNA hydrolase [Scopulibacillus darangshiensis]TCP22544.1 peptidyl-tRNA hydrolase [Scopulibacillus darangshiensis]